MDVNLKSINFLIVVLITALIFYFALGVYNGSCEIKCFFHALQTYKSSVFCDDNMVCSANNFNLLGKETGKYLINQPQNVAIITDICTTYNNFSPLRKNENEIYFIIMDGNKIPINTNIKNKIYWSNTSKESIFDNEINLRMDKFYKAFAGAGFEEIDRESLAFELIFCLLDIALIVFAIYGLFPIFKSFIKGFHKRKA